MLKVIKQQWFKMFLFRNTYYKGNGIKRQNSLKIYKFIFIILFHTFFYKFGKNLPPLRKVFFCGEEAAQETPQASPFLFEFTLILCKLI